MINFEPDHPDKLNLHFFAVADRSITVIRKNLDLFEEKCANYTWDTPTPKILRNILITPIKIGPRSRFLWDIKDLKKQGFIDRIIFDSGGFQLMTGSLKDQGIVTINNLINRDKHIYKNSSDYVDVFMSLDDPPTGSDSEEVMQKKIQDTIDIGLRFFNEMPPIVQGRMAPIYQCRRVDQLEQFHKAYEPIYSKSNFVSYSAASATAEGAIRSITQPVMEVLDQLVKDRKHVHCLGIVSPLAVFMLALLGIRTYDGSSASKSAGNGFTYWPYRRAVPFSDHPSKLDFTPTQKELEQLRKDTGHHCPFCENREDLINNDRYRFLHNLIVQDQLSYFYRDLDIDKFARLQKTKKYTQLIEAFLQNKGQVRYLRNVDQLSLF